MINVGHVAQKDPLFAYSTVMASELLKHVAAQPAARRRAWIRAEMNKTNPGIGDAVLEKLDSLIARGWDQNQALFDALRLTIANQIASVLDKRAQHTAGLGESSEDINAVFCGIMGTATVGGSIYGAASSNPTGSAAVGQAGSSAMTAAGCNVGALREQARIAEANARAAEAAVAAGAAGMQVSASGDKTMLYVVGGGVALVALRGVALVLRKK